MKNVAVAWKVEKDGEVILRMEGSAATELLNLLLDWMEGRCEALLLETAKGTHAYRVADSVSSALDWATGGQPGDSGIV